MDLVGVGAGWSPKDVCWERAVDQTQVHAALLVLSVGEMQSESTWEVISMSCVEWEAYCQEYLRVLNALSFSGRLLTAASPLVGFFFFFLFLFL